MKWLTWLSTLIMKRHAIFFLMLVLLLLDVALILCLFYPPLSDLMLKSTIFQILVITALAEILIVVSARIAGEAPLAYSRDSDVQEQIRELLERDKDIKRVQVISAGLNSRANFLRSLLENHRELNLQVLACYSEANPDRLDREEFGPTGFKQLTHRLEMQESERLQIWQSQNTPSLRCVLLSTKKGPRYGFLGWYIYSKRNSEIKGRENHQIFVDWSTQFGYELLHFATTVFDNSTKETECEALWPKQNTIAANQAAN